MMEISEVSDLFEKLLPLFGFVFASTITPGPNNLMLAASGERFGYRRTLPHLTGIVLGVTGLIVACMFGLGKVVANSAAMTTGLKLFASVYLVYLIIQLARPRPADNEQQSKGRPLNIAQGALFQLINPKAWVMAITGIALLSDLALSAVQKIVVLSLAFLFIGVSCNHLWLLSGITVKRCLTSASGRVAFNSVVGALTVYAVVSIWYG